MTLDEVDLWTLAFSPPKPFLLWNIFPLSHESSIVILCRKRMVLKVLKRVPRMGLHLRICGFGTEDCYTNGLLTNVYRERSQRGNSTGSICRSHGKLLGHKVFLIYYCETRFQGVCIMKREAFRVLTSLGAVPVLTSACTGKEFSVGCT